MPPVLPRHAHSQADAFASELDSQLTDFEFPDDFVLDVRICAMAPLMAQVFEMVHPGKK